MKKMLTLVLIGFIAIGSLFAGGSNESSSSSISENSSPVDTTCSVELLPMAGQNARPADVPFTYSVVLASQNTNKPTIQAKAGDTIQLGGVDWRVLEVKDGKAFVLSDKVLLKGPYHSFSYPIAWDDCSLREFLNGEFFNTVFSADEKQRIVETQIVNSKNPWFPAESPNYPWYSMPGGKNTTDKVFLLSLDEVVKYFGDSGKLAEGTEKTATAPYFINDQFNAKRIAQTQDGTNAWWWLRSPGLFYSACGANFKQISAISQTGILGLEGEMIGNENGGVRPAMWIKL